MDIGVLKNDVKWVRHLMLAGFSVVLTVIGYFSVELGNQQKAGHEMMMELTKVVSQQAVDHRVGYEKIQAELAKKDIQLKVLNDYCCNKKIN